MNSRIRAMSLLSLAQHGDLRGVSQELVLLKVCSSKCIPSALQKVLSAFQLNMPLKAAGGMSLSVETQCIRCCSRVQRECQV